MKHYLKWLYRNCEGYVVLHDRRLYLDEGDSLRLYRNGTYSPYLVDLCKQYSFGDVFVDAGASIGWFSCNVAPTADRVLSFEPNPEQFSVLSKNAMTYHNIVAKPVALWSGGGEASLFVDLENGSGATMVDVSGRPTVTVHRTTLDEALEEENIGGIGVLKMDCEGAEAHILDGFSQLETMRPVIAMEFMYQAIIASGKSPVALWRRLFNYGDVFFVDEDKGNCIARNEHDSLQDGNYLIQPK